MIDQPRGRPPELDVEQDATARTVRSAQETLTHGVLMACKHWRADGAGAVSSVESALSPVP